MGEYSISFLRVSHKILMFFSFKEKTFEQRWTPLRRGDFVSGDGLKNEGGNLKVCVECKVCF